MRQFLLSLCFLLMVCALVTAQNIEAANKANPDSTFGACTAGNSIIIANRCAGATLGIKVNAADGVLGNNPGEIWLYGGGAMGDQNSRITISSNHVLRAFPGTYTSKGYSGVILLKSDSALICEAGAVFEEPTHTAIRGQNVFVIVDAYGLSVTTPANTRQPNRNIKVQGCTFKGARSDFSAAASAVQLGNCHNCEVSGNRFENLHQIAVEYGAPPTAGEIDPLGLGRYADGSSIHHNVFVHCNAVNVAMVNGQNISISDNIFLRPGIKGGYFPISIDIEPNTAADRVLRITVANNIMDHTGAAMVGNGIMVSNCCEISPGLYGQILITGNTFTGGLDSTAIVSRMMARAISVGINAYDVTAVNNTIRYATFPIFTEGIRGHFADNSVFGGSAGNYAIWLYTSSSENTVAGNRIYCNPALTSGCNTEVRNDGATSNLITGNVRPGRPTIAAGTGAGTTPTVTVTGDHTSGYITVTTGSAPLPSATVATITYASNHGNVRVSIPLSPANSNAAALSGGGQVYVDLSESNGSAFVVKVGGTQLAPRTQYSWFYGPVKQ
jgi:hypothetical protein